LYEQGEQKQLHLYEARFLSLFEDAIKEHGGCVGMLGFFEEGELAAVAVLCEILEWRRLDVGVHVRMRAASRVTVKGLTQIEPYIQVSACEFLDGERDKDDAVPASLTDEVCMHACTHARWYLCMHTCSDKHL
jgi:Lon protease-like protein